MTPPPAGAARAVFFDAVGTLLHPDPPAAAAYHAAGARHGSRVGPADARARFAAAFRRQEEVDFAAGLCTDEGREVRRWQAIVGEVLDDVADPEACFRELYEHFARPGAWRVDPEAGPALAALKRRGCALGVASNFDGRLRPLVARMPELASIRHVVVSSEVGWRKPAPGFFEALCREVGLPPGRVLLVGDDRVNDLEGARAAGLQALLLDGRGNSADTLARLAELPGRLA